MPEKNLVMDDFATCGFWNFSAVRSIGIRTVEDHRLPDLVESIQQLHRK
jgi:hypothetical protein